MSPSFFHIGSKISFTNVWIILLQSANISKYQLKKTVALITIFEVVRVNNNLKKFIPSHNIKSRMFEKSEFS